MRIFRKASEVDRGTREHKSLLGRYWAVTAAVVSVSVAILGLSEMQFAFSENRQRLLLQQQTEARAAAGRIREHLGLIEAEAIQVAKKAPTALRAEFKALLARVPDIRSVVVLGPTGREALYLSRVEIDRSDEETLALLLTESRQGDSQLTYGSPIFVGGAPTVQLRIRAARSSQVETVVELDLRFVTDLIEKITIGVAGRVYVLDANGALVAHWNPIHVLRRKSLAQSALFSEWQRTPFAGEFSLADSTLSLDGEEVFVSASQIAQPKWLLAVEQPVEEIAGPLRKSAARLAALLLLALAGSFIASRWAAKELARPIEVLRLGAKRIGSGDFSERIRVNTGDAIEGLADSFNTMAAKLEEYTSGLANLVAEKTQELERANAHKSEFLANVSHELRTPLNAVIGMSEALQAEIFGPLTAKQSEYVGDIHDSGRHLLALINDLLDMSKIEAGRMDLEPGEFSVRALLQSAAALVRDRALQEGVRLRLDLGADLAIWRADERRFKQIVLNLLANAVKFTRSGGDVVLGARQTDSELTVYVQDTGVGIAEENISALFEEFRQLRIAGAAMHEGTGLGLALTKRLVELHGGTIKVESTLGLGSTFTVTLPRLADRATS